MHRRSFLTLLGGAAAAWPLGARAQQPLPVIGVLSGGTRSANESAVTAFAQGLRQQGYVEDRNVSIEYIWAGGHYDLLPSLAAEFVRRRVTAIVTFGGTPTVDAAKAATTTIPIVFLVGSDPVAAGLVAALNRPGGNLTGATILSIELGPKRLEMVRDLVPNVARIGLLINPTNRNVTETLVKETQDAAAKLGVAIQAVSASGDGELEPAFENLIQGKARALVVAADPFHLSRRERIASLAARHRMPTIYASREFVDAGGLLSYGSKRAAAYVIVGDYAGRILKGAKPADLPVQQPAAFELVINLKVAKRLGLTIPAGILAIADEVIE